MQTQKPTPPPVCSHVREDYKQVKVEHIVKLKGPVVQPDKRRCARP